MALPAILTAIQGGLALKNALTGPERDFRENPCPGSPTAAEVTRAFQNGPPERLSRVVAAWALVHGTKPFPYTNPYEFLGAIMGGGDCKVTSRYGSSLQSEAIGFVREFGAYNGPVMGGDGTGPIDISSGSGLGAQIQRVGDSIKEAASNVLRGTVSGAVAGARASSQGAAAGAQAGTFAAENSIPLLMFGALGLVLFLVFRKR